MSDLLGQIYNFLKIKIILVLQSCAQFVATTTTTLEAKVTLAITILVFFIYFLDFISFSGLSILLLIFAVMFWFLSTPSKKNTTYPVKRQVSITTTHVPGTSRSNAAKLVERYSSPRGFTPNAITTTNYYTSPSTISEEMDDNDDGATESSSSGSGSRMETISELQGSFNYPRHQIDKCTWSNVTSPGFTTRVVNAGNNSSPLRESQNYLTSPNNNLRYPTDPHSHLKMGEFHPPVWNKPVAPPVARFPSPIMPLNGATNHRRLSKSWLFSESNTLSTSARNRNIDESTSYIRIAPLEPGKNYIPSPPISNDNVNNSAGGASSSKIMMGLGGIPQSALTSRYHQRLLPNVPYENNLIIRTSSSPPPSPPSNDVLHALANRKRGRPTSVENNTSNSSKGSPNSRNLQICSPDEIIKNNTKRVKFYNQMHDERMNHVPLSVPPNSHDGEPMSTESILEQLNQTEKRFLPHDDDLLKTYGNENKRLRSGPNPNINNNSTSNSQRKRRVSNNSQKLEADDPREKTGRFCECNECYLELAGSVSYDHDHDHNKSNNILKETSVVDGINKKSIATVNHDTSMSSSINSVLIENKGDRNNSSKLCDRGTETDWLHLNARTGTNRPILTPKTSRSYVVDIEKYKADKLKSIERFNRLLDLHPIKIKETKSEEKIVVENNSTVSEGLINKSNEINVTSTPTSKSGGFSFGSSTETVTTFSNTPTSNVPAGFSFGLNPPAATENKSSTTSDSLPPTTASTSTTTTFGSGFNFGQNINSEVPTLPPSPTPALTTTTAASTLFNTQPIPQVESTSAPGGFSFGGFQKQEEKPVESNSASITVPTITSTTTSFSIPSANFSFGSSIPNSNSAITTTTSSLPATLSSTAPSFSFGAIGNQEQQNTSTVPATAATGFTFGQPQTQPQQRSNNAGFDFGGMPKKSEATTQETKSTPAPAFSFGGSDQNQSSSLFSIPSVPVTTSTPSNNGSFSFGSPATALSTTTGSNFSFGQNNLGNQQQTTTTTSAAAPTPVASSLFSIPNIASPTPSPGIFSFGGSSGSSEQQKQTNFMTPTAASTASSAPPFSFGSPTTNASILPSNSNTGSSFSFGQNLGSTQTSNFQNPASTTSTTSLFGQQPNNTTSGGFAFGQQTQTQQQANPTPGFSFGSTTQQQPAPSNSIFSTPGGQTSNSGFAFGQQTQQQANPTPGFSFGSTTTTPQQPSSFSIFGSPAAGSTSNTSTFSFGQPAQQQQQQQANPPAFTFGSASPPTAAVSPFSSATGGFNTFGQQPQQQQQQSNPGFNFGGANQPSTTGGGFPFAAAPAANTGNTGMFQFTGQQPQPGGFNFAAPQTNFSVAGAQQPNQMFNLGASATSNSNYARRRETRRRR